jgi:hypothetical protein
MNWYRKANLESVLSRYGYSEENLDWIGSGDFGNAYSMGDGKVLKETSSQGEAEIAKQLMGMSGAFAKIYDVTEDGGYYYILQEEVETDGHIEDLFGELQNLLSFEELPIQYIGMFDERDLPDGYSVSDEMRSFINGIENINRVYGMLGIEASDIRPENMGYRDGELVAFDMDNKHR